MSATRASRMRTALALSPHQNKAAIQAKTKWGHITKRRSTICRQFSCTHAKEGKEGPLEQPSTARQGRGSAYAKSTRFQRQNHRLTRSTPLRRDFLRCVGCSESAPPRTTIELNRQSPSRGPPIEKQGKRILPADLGIEYVTYTSNPDI